MSRALLLNATFEPLCIVSFRRAVVLVLKDKAEIVARDFGEFHSERMSVPCPSVIRELLRARVGVSDDDSRHERRSLTQ